MHELSLKRSSLSLEEIGSKYNVVLADTCSLLSSLEERDSIYLQNDRLKRAAIRHDSFYRSAEYFYNFVMSGGELYATSRIINEYTPSSRGDYQKKVKRNNDDLSKERKRIALECSRSIRDSHRMRRKLIDFLFTEGRILNEEENPEYKRLSSRFESFKSSISETDYDLLITGATRSRETPTAIVSNDFQILTFWKKVLRGENIDPSQLGFFFRKEFSSFVPAHYFS